MTAPAKHPGGRPKLPPEDRHSERLLLVLTPAGLETVTAAATRAGVERAVWCREALLRAARRVTR
jgi:hypothetical protein